MWSVQPITKETADQWVTIKHYSHRPSIFWKGFALYIDGGVEGVVVYGQPSPPVQRHAFTNRQFRLYELTRLVIQTRERNAASFLIGRSLQQLERPSAVVSYADTEWGHAGIVYQATNWIYTGSTTSHDHTYLVDGVRTHPITLRDRGISNPKQWARENNITTLPPMPKHRYFFLNGSKRQRKEMMSQLNYPVIDQYPKLPYTRYDDGPPITGQLALI